MELDRTRVVVGGAEGTIRWGYHEAMRLAKWTFSGSGHEGGTVTATVVSRHPFRLSQQPLALVLNIVSRDQPWQWPPPPEHAPVKLTTTRVSFPVVRLADDEGRLTIFVGPCERT